MSMGVYQNRWIGWATWFAFFFLFSSQLVHADPISALAKKLNFTLKFKTGLEVGIWTERCWMIQKVKTKEEPNSETEVLKLIDVSKIRRELIRSKILFYDRTFGVTRTKDTALHETLNSLVEKCQKALPENPPPTFKSKTAQAHLQSIRDRERASDEFKKDQTALNDKERLERIIPLLEVLNSQNIHGGNADRDCLKLIPMHPEFTGEDQKMKGSGLVYYMRDSETQESRATIKNGLFFDSRNIPITTSVKGAIYVIDQEGNLYFSSAEGKNIHHSSFFRGKPVAGAGIVRLSEGKLIHIDNRSGHYTPDPDSFLKTLRSLKRQGVLINESNLDITPDSISPKTH